LWLQPGVQLGAFTAPPQACQRLRIVLCLCAMSDTPLVMVLNGPNLNLLGSREPRIYGHDTLDDIAGRLEAQATRLGLAVDIRQSNHEGQLVDWLHEAGARRALAVILNAGAFTHTSIAIHDAIKGIAVPVIEVHLSNPHAREHFRHTSYVAMAAKGSISGFGAASYALALDAAAALRQ
jgi:3-dehydroquinate dehydratase-2